MCLDFLNENVQEAKFCFGYNLKSIGPTTLHKTAKLRHFQRPFQQYPLCFCSFSTFLTLIFFQKGVQPWSCYLWKVKILLIYLLYESWFYNFMKISLKNNY